MKLLTMSSNVSQLKLQQLTVTEKDTTAAGALGRGRHRGHTAAAKLLLVRTIMRGAEVYSDDHLPTAFNALESGTIAATILFQTHALC